MSSRTKECLLFVLGVAICFAVAGLSILIERFIPGELLGAYIIALFLTKDKVLLIICTFILFFLPQFEKRPILKVAKGATISNIKVLASGEPSAKRFY